jgi:predicted permease
VDPGFDTTRVLKAQYQLPGTRYPIDYSRWPNEPEVTGFHTRFLAAVRSIPGVESAAIAGGHPLDPGFTNSFTILGREAESADFPEIRTRFITPGYLETVSVELLEGRDIRAGDDGQSPAVALINDAARRAYFPDGALGQEIAFWGTTRRIVGVIGDEKFKGIDAPTDPAAYVPLAQNPQQSATLLVRSRGDDPTALVPTIRQRFRQIDPQLALYGVEPLANTLAQSIGRPRFMAILLTLFGVLAILLALIGIHGVMSYTVARRRPEVGIRMALGASRGAVMRSVVGEGLGLAGIGLALGLVGAFLGARFLESLVFGVTTTDPATFAVVSLLVLATAGLATSVPAWRAAKADPAGALRGE